MTFEVVDFLCTFIKPLHLREEMEGDYLDKYPGSENTSHRSICQFPEMK